MQGRVHLRLLGPPLVETADGRRVALERRIAGLLAYLALEGETSRARLVELLWPDTDPDAARNALRQRLFQLKKRLGIELVQGTDVLALGEALAPDVPAADRQGTTMPLLDGCDFADCDAFDDWLTVQRDRLAGSVRAELASRAEAADLPFDLAQAAHWILDTANRRVPAEFRDSFLNRNVSNRELLRAAG
jgi:DNA-binding SARP family transcriptional activator